MSPLLKRPVSIWTLRGRLGSRDSSKQAAINGAVAAAPESPKPSKVGFFSRFRR
jgi:hypothetical protein